MNNKGFTLIELLAVIIILSLLAILASTSVTKIVRDSKSDLYSTQLELIKTAAETWGADNINKLPSAGECKYITLGALKSYGLIDQNIKNPKTNTEFSDDIKIKISSNTTIYGNLNLEYEVVSQNIGSCENVYPTICTAVKTATTGKIPLGNYDLGDEYTCEVKDGISYTFFVIGKDEKNVNFIMNQNINSDGTPAGTTGVTQSTNTELYNLVAWQTSGQNADGPVTAMDFLYNATSSWTNIPNITMNYTDEASCYGTIVTTNNITRLTKKDGSAITVLTDKTGYTNLKARMPYKSEVSGYDSTNKTNAYLYDYLELYNNIQTNAVSGIYSYWLLSSSVPDEHPDNTGFALGLIYEGYLDYHNSSYDNDTGVRPVISIPKYNIS